MNRLLTTMIVAMVAWACFTLAARADSAFSVGGVPLSNAATMTRCSDEVARECYDVLRESYDEKIAMKTVVKKFLKCAKRAWSGQTTEKPPLPYPPTAEMERTYQRSHHPSKVEIDELIRGGSWYPCVAKDGRKTACPMPLME